MVGSLFFVPSRQPGWVQPPSNKQELQVWTHSRCQSLLLQLDRPLHPKGKGEMHTSWRWRVS